MKNPDAGEEVLLSRPPLVATLFCLLALAMVVAVYSFGNFSNHAAVLPSEIRVRNNTSIPFYKIIVNGQAYGDLNPGEASAYRSMQPAYRYADVSLIAGVKKIHLMPDDYVGEKPLGHGKFSYVINGFGEGNIDVTLASDSDRGH